MVRRLIVCAVLCLAACGGKQSPPPPVQNAAPPEPVAAPKPARKKDDSSVAIAKMSDFADQMCTCAGKECADAVMADMTKWASEMANDPGSSERKPTEAEMKQMTEIGTRFAECMTQAMTPPSTP